MLPKRCFSGNGGTIQAGYSKVNAVCNQTKSWYLLRTGLGLGTANVSTEVYITYNYNKNTLLKLHTIIITYCSGNEISDVSSLGTLLLFSITNSDSHW